MQQQPGWQPSSLTLPLPRCCSPLRRAYTWWDAYLCFTSLAGQIVTWRVLGPLLRDPAAFPAVWHWHLELALNTLTCVLMLALIWRWPAVYRRHRHAFAVANRLLRIGFALAAVWQRGPELHALVAPVLGRSPRYTTKMDLDTAIHNVTRIIALTCMTSLSWVSWAGGCAAAGGAPVAWADP